MPAVRIEGLCVRRGSRPVLRDVSLDLPAGRISGLLGPSGCGKTTLMRCIVGVQTVAAGTVTVLDRPAGSPELRRRVAYVTQAPSVYGDLTVRENLRYFARVLGVSRERVEEVVSAVGLESHATDVTRELSGGQLARVSLGTALLAEPELLVLDEPTVGLDPVLRNDLWQRFRELADGGAALLVSSHVMDEAERCDDLVLMREGEIVAAEPPAEVLRRTGTDTVEQAFLALARGRSEDR